MAAFNVAEVIRRFPAPQFYSKTIQKVRAASEQKQDTAEAAFLVSGHTFSVVDLTFFALAGRRVGRRDV